MARSETTYYAFFDVDGTLIKGKPMMDFLRFYYHARFYYCRIIGEISYKIFDVKSKILSKIGLNRNFINKIYYHCYKGQNVNWLSQIGIEWFDSIRNNPCIYIKNVLKELIKHQKNGAEIVLVSGSFFPCLVPFAKQFNIKHILSTSLQVKNHRLTGRILTPQTIGQGKKQAIQDFLQKNNCSDLNKCYAYGDHNSDIPMLSLVGNPRVIGGDPVLENYAKSNGWKIIN